jgi:AraC family transcriptional regulator
MRSDRRKLVPSAQADEQLQVSLTACSLRAGWRSVLLRAYRDPPPAGEFTTLPTADHQIVLVTGGACDMEERRRGHWLKVHCEVGNIAMLAPGHQSNLRRLGRDSYSMLKLHLPGSTIRRVLEDLSERDAGRMEMLDTLTSVDPVIQHVMLGLAGALSDGAPDLYAEAAADLLAAHLLVRDAGCPKPRPATREDLRMGRVEAFIRANLGESLSLDAMAQEAGLSRFHFTRVFTRAYGETPVKHLTRLRMEEARHLLTRSLESVTEVALRCGYDNPAHFASAFRRIVGVSPSTYRRAIR